jgi:hypothetical protein
LFHKRRHERVKRRFACEFLAEGQRYRGIIVELSRAGLFIQTDATTNPGAEIELQLAAAGAVPELRLRGVVVRRRMVPAPLATVVRRGIAVEILEAPREYGLACGSELLHAPIRLARRGTSERGNAAEDAADPGPPRVEAPEHRPLAAEIPVRAAPAAPPEPSPVERAASDEAGLPTPPEALLVDDGTLSDVDALLRELGVEARRIEIGTPAFLEPWVRPQRLLVTTAALACSPALPELRADDGLVGIAVAEDESQTLTAMMLRLGFQYLVHRPTHPEALRLLLRRALYRGAEQRRAERRPLGSEVVWCTRWRKRRGPMVEISATGCRLHAVRGPRPGQRIRIWIPAEATGDRRIVLRGRIARRELLPRAGESETYSLAVAFDAPRARMQRRLDALLARCDRGPAMLARVGSAEPGAPAADVSHAPEAAEPLPAPAPPPALTAEPAGAPRAADAAGRPGADRRRVPRVRLDREVVALDAAGTRALHALVGRDFSSQGMRVDPHPELGLGQRLRLALYEPSVARPVMLDAEVARDDGEAGLALRFVDVTPETAAEIVCIVGALPALQALRPEPRRIVLGEWLGAGAE